MKASELDVSVIFVPLKIPKLLMDRNIRAHSLVKMFTWLSILFAGASFTVHAQNPVGLPLDFENVSPKEIPETDGPEGDKVEEEPETEIDPTDPGSGIKLRGIQIVSAVDEIAQEGVTVEGVVIKGLPLLDSDEFRDEMGRFWGAPMTMGTFNQVIRKIVLFYGEQGFQVVDAILPQQRLDTGTLQVLVIEGNLNEVSVENARWFVPERMERQIRAPSGEKISSVTLEEDLDWLNRNPFRSVEAVFERGEEIGQTDLKLRVSDRYPLRLYGGVDDSGNSTTGDERIFVGFNAGNFLELENEFSYRYTTSANLKDFKAHAVSWDIPLRWRHTLKFFGFHAETHPDFGADSEFEAEGDSWQVSARYEVPLPGFTFGDKRFRYEHAVTAGFDFKQSDNNLAFGGVALNEPTDINQFLIEYNGTLVDPLGYTLLSLEGVYSPGNWSPNNKDSNFEGSRAFSDSTYFYASLNLTRNTKLPWDFRWVSKFGGQLANKNLLPSEQLNLGGRYSIRGYEENEANGDWGWWVSNQINTPSISPIDLLNIQTQYRDSVYFSAFLDHGVAKKLDALEGEDASLKLSSVGAGLRYNFSSYFSLSFDYAWQLVDLGFENNETDNSRMHVSVFFSY